MHVWRVSLNGFVLNNVVFTHWKEGSTSCSISVQTKSNFADRLHGKRNHESVFCASFSRVQFWVSAFIALKNIEVCIPVAVWSHTGCISAKLTQ